MKSIVKYRKHLNWLVIIVLSAVLWLSPVNVAIAQNNSVTVPRDVFSRLEQLKNEVSNMRSVASKSLGPYPIYTRCTWCSKKEWWGLGLCTKETTETWDTKVDFTWTRRSLSRVLERVQQNTNTFARSYEPTQVWLKGIPDFSKKFDVTADIVLAVQQEIKSGVGPNNQQRKTVKQALQELGEDLDRSSSLLQGGTSALAAFLQQQSAYKRDIQQAIDGADRSAKEALANLEKQSQTHHCQGGLNEKYASIKADFSRSLQEISVAFQKLEGSSREAEKSLAQLLGSVVSSQTELKSVLDLVNAAGNDKLGSFLEKLHLNAAKQQWRDLANSATSNLSSGWLTNTSSSSGQNFRAAVVKVSGETCPSGSTLVAYKEALDNRAVLSQKLGTWDIARLANGGSMDGSGYNSKIRATDERTLGHALCKRLQ
ncbi:hypothetical protein [Lyngbya sp. PCC 8106]|uniref:hypothetical protein n=1 Tax=Lyngbya sp. (strain PCC 8106) TaxID=313612 RepID=UPI0000EAAFDB|nr:hypothetical protein [Lyngbya sp. PCC 8106]EAW39366.1 hypothetical protein L8106_05471 [Lyngbya sp. PCC 8106]